MSKIYTYAGDAEHISVVQLRMCEILADMRMLWIILGRERVSQCQPWAWLVTSVKILSAHWTEKYWAFIGQKSAAGHLRPSPGCSLPIRAVRCRLLIDRYTQRIKHASPVTIRPRKIPKLDSRIWFRKWKERLTLSHLYLIGHRGSFFTTTHWINF